MDRSLASWREAAAYDHQTENDLTRSEREEISRGVVAGQSIRAIASSLGRAPSTVSREICRNGGRERYRADLADQAAWERATDAMAAR